MRQTLLPFACFCRKCRSLTCSHNGRSTPATIRLRFDYGVDYWRMNSEPPSSDARDFSDMAFAARDAKAMWLQHCSAGAPREKRRPWCALPLSDYLREMGLRMPFDDS